MKTEEFEFLRDIEKALKDSGIVEAIQSEVRNRAFLWGQDDKKTCWLTSCTMQVCFNEKDREHIHTAEPFLMLSIGTIQNVHVSMSVHGDTEYDTIYCNREVTYDNKRQR